MTANDLNQSFSSNTTKVVSSRVTFDRCSAKAELCDRCCLSVCLYSMSRITHKHVYGCRSNMVDKGKGLPSSLTLGDGHFIRCIVICHSPEGDTAAGLWDGAFNTICAQSVDGDTAEPWRRLRSLSTLVLWVLWEWYRLCRSLEWYSRV